MEKFLYIKQILASLEPKKYSNCFHFNVIKDKRRLILSNQAIELEKILDRVLNFKMKFLKLNLNVSNHNDTNNIINQDRKLNNIALVISSLALALDGALCSSKLSFDTRRTNDLFDIDLEKEFKESEILPKSCKCQKELCVGCTHYCKRFCRQRYSLSNWNCESINGTNTVSLNLICDGKNDCFDESDEKGCVTGMSYENFEASEMFDNVLNMLQSEASKLPQPIQKKIVFLSDLIMELQKLTMKSVPKFETTKNLRDKCYSILSTIYSDTVKQSDMYIEPEETYLFLLSINQNLGTALKLSHTGNSITIDSGCHCKNGTCSASFCSKICTRACAVEPKLMRYYCGRSNKYVVLEKVCDGVRDCKDGYDEANCKIDEICRRHHLVVLQHNLQGVGANLKGTALGELLSSWKFKVISSLKSMENLMRLTPNVLKKILENIIKDLAVTYGSVEKHRKTTDYAMGVFLDISQIVLESIKSCRMHNLSS